MSANGNNRHTTTIDGEKTMPTEFTSLLGGNRDGDSDDISMSISNDDDASQSTPPPPEVMQMTMHNDTRGWAERRGSTRILRIKQLHKHLKTKSIIGNSERSSVSVNGGRFDISGGGPTSHDDASTEFYHHQSQAMLYLEKVKSTWFEDTRRLTEGTIPQSVVLALVIGIVCGVAAWLYYTVLYFMLEFVWETLPDKIAYFNDQVVLPDGSVSSKPSQNAWVWIPLVSLVMAVCLGLSVVILGEPGDLPYVISRVHNQAYVPMDHVLPMIVASNFSILAGGSLGPEAPLVAICGALGGFVSRTLFRQNHVNIVRKHTMMGMAGALAAFFGCPLGGSLFALEVCSRFGIEYFEHMIESIFCGEICLVVFRSLSGLAIKPIWDLTKDVSGNVERMAEAKPWEVVVGGFIGLLGSFVAYCFATFHWANMEMFARLDLLDNKRAVYRALLGGSAMMIIGLFIPHTMFWGEEEFQVLSTMAPASELPHIWPTGGIIGFEMNSAATALAVGVGKLVAISFTVAGGLRGGYIFPLMCCGAAFGRVLHAFVGTVVPLQMSVLCMAAGVNVAITRTSLATTLILAFLAGEPCAVPAILAASLCSLFATAYLPFIKSQITRSDIDHSLFHDEHLIPPDAILAEDSDEDNYDDVNDVNDDDDDGDDNKD